MAAEDELAIPEVPEAKPEDPEDVSWALSTAEAMWARGDHLEGIKWVRKAAEAASDAEDDERALELAKAASELTTLIARRSRASIGDGPGLAGGAPPELTTAPASKGAHGTQPPGKHGTQPPSVSPTSTPASVPPATSRMGGAPALPPDAAAAREARLSAPPNAPSIPPAPPLPSAVSSAPAAPVASVATAASSPPGAATAAAGTASKPAPFGKAAPVGRSVAPGPIPLPSRASTAPKAPAIAPRAAPRPLATADAKQGPQPGKGVLSNRVAEPAKATAKGRRRSRENLDAEALAAGLLDTAPQPAVDASAAEHALASEMGEVTTVGAVEMPVANARVKRRSRPDVEPTVVARREELIEAARDVRERSAEEWDASPTQNLTGDEMDDMDQGERKTAFAIPVSVDLAAPSSKSAPPPPVRPPLSTVHDPEIQTSQAVRVVVWRDGTGVHVAPAGTVVSSITIDAVLVVLEPSADLTAWLSQRER